MVCFGSVIDNWYNIMSRTKRLTAFTASYSQAAVIFPFILTAPAYFAGKIQLGGMLQTSSAFGSVQKALSFFVSAYRTLADWRAIVARLDGFEMSIESAATLSSEPQTVGVVDHAGDSIELAQLLLKLPNGLPLIAADGFSIKSSERTLLTGPSGAGKSTLFRQLRQPDRSARISRSARCRPRSSTRLLRTVSVSSRSRMRSLRSGCRSWRTGWTRTRIGIACCRSASSSASGWPAPCCMARNTCSWTKPQPRWTSRAKRDSIA